MTGLELYAMVGQLLLGYQMDKTLFYQLLALSKGNREQARPWSVLRKEDTSQSVAPVGNNYGNSLYLTPLNLPDDFLVFYSVKRSIILVAADGITFRWYGQIPVERKHEYKDDDTKFYIDQANKKFYLCGILDRPYTVHLFYIKSSPAITDSTSWVFPSQFHPILAFDVAKMYREMFDYDVVNAAQAQTIERGAALIYEMMKEWESTFQEASISSVDYPDQSGTEGFRNSVVGDNNTY